MSSKEDVEVRVLAPTKAYKSLDYQDEPRVVEIIRDRVLPQSKGEYYRVDVKIQRKKDQTPQHLVAYMLRKDIYLAEVVKVDVDADFHEKGIVFNYDESKEKEKEEEEEEELPITEERGYECAYDFVVATPVPYILTAKKAVEELHNLAISIGLRSKMLLGEEATIANYKQYLTCGLKGFVNIGHGNPNMIILDDGPLESTWFSSVSNEALNPTVVYFNSCQVHNDPLKTAVIGAGARTFIGGIVNLLIRSSEEVCKCFWIKTLKSTIRMDDSLHNCEKEKYPNEGSHGITGDTGPFLYASEKVHSFQVLEPQSGEVPSPDTIMKLGKLPVEHYRLADGYNPDFLGSMHKLPLPNLAASLLPKVAKLKDGSEILTYLHFSILMNADRRLAFYTAANIDGKELKKVKREDKWYFDPRLDMEYQAGPQLYEDNPLDRGHLVRRLDPCWGPNAKDAGEDTFHFTNCSPQHKNLNQHDWLEVEDYILNTADNADVKISVFTGPVFREDDMIYRNEYLLPADFWKVVAFINKNGKLNATAYMRTQKNYLENMKFFDDEFKTWQVPVAQIEALTGLSFNLPSDADPMSRAAAGKGLEIQRNNIKRIRSVDDIML